MSNFRPDKAVEEVRGGDFFNSVANFRETKVDSFKLPEG
jgi:hypothetical protein